MFIGSASGIIGFIIGLLCIQAKMTLPPFHIPEAETEIVEGPFMEYSGPPLGFWKLNHFMMYVVFPFLLVLLFWGGFNFEGIGILWSVLEYLLIVVLMIIIKNTNPRIRIDTALNFFWKYATPLTLDGDSAGCVWVLNLINGIIAPTFRSEIVLYNSQHKCWGYEQTNDDLRTRINDFRILILTS